MFSMCSELTPRARIPDTRYHNLCSPVLTYLFRISAYALIFFQNQLISMGFPNISKQQQTCIPCHKYFQVEHISSGILDRRKKVQNHQFMDFFLKNMSYHREYFSQPKNVLTFSYYFNPSCRLVTMGCSELQPVATFGDAGARFSSSME